MNFFFNLIPDNIRKDIKLFLTYFSNFKKFLIFFILIFFVSAVILYFFFFTPFIFFYYFLLFFKNIKIYKSELTYVQSDFNLNNFFIFIKFVFWESLFIYSFYYLYNFLKNFYTKEKELSSFFNFLKNKEFFKNFVFTRLFKFIFFIIYKVFSISLNLTEIFYNLKFEWCLNWDIIWGYFFLEISDFYFIPLKKIILKRRVFVENNKIIFNPNKNLLNNVASTTKALLEDIKNNKLIMIRNDTEGRSTIHLAFALSLNDNEFIYTAETKQKELRVLNLTENKWKNVENIKAGTGSLNKELDQVYNTPPILTEKRSLSVVNLNSEKYSAIVTCNISKSNFINPFLINLNEPFLELKNKKIILNDEYKTLKFFLENNTKNFSFKTQYFIDSILEFDEKFGKSINQLTKEEKIKLYSMLISGELTNHYLLMINQIFDEM